jgi:arabinogalactan oligomer/maltooligosaccharide transport system substrate-binding protein
VGPDLVIGDAFWIPDLADEGLIEPYGKENGMAMSELGREAVTYNDQIYGLPFFVRPYALYYNQSMVDQPPATIEELVIEVSGGNTAAFIPRFREAYWGIEAFGADLFDEDGNLDLVDSGFLPWLRWLGAAQNEPGLIMNVDDQRLEELFSAGEIAYYIAEPYKINRLQEALGDDLAVTILPSGPFGGAGPLLNTEAILFFSYSSAQQAEMVRILGEFLANPQQSVQFMRELNKVPAHPRVSIDSRLYPAVTGFSRQARTAVTIPAGWDLNLLQSAGDRAYAAVLSGEMSADQAVCAFARVVQQGTELEDQAILVAESCELNVEE